MYVLFDILFILVLIWLVISVILFIGKWVDWSLANSLNKTYQRHVDGGNRWYESSVADSNDEMIEASRGMIGAFTWPLRIFGGAYGMLTHGRQKTSAEVKQEEKFRRELEASLAREKAKQMSEWEKEFRNA